jgi:hypothetical protein
MKPVTVLVTAALYSLGHEASAETFTDNFTSYISGSSGTLCFQQEGSQIGPWNLVFKGYGQACIVKSSRSTAWMNLTPQAPSSPGETHAGLVSGRSFTQPFTYSVAARTVKQLRKNSPPNAWEVAWIIWDYVPAGSSSKFYYFSFKRNGWELGQFDTGSQRFLATGNSPRLTLNSWYTFTVSQTGGSSSCAGTELRVSVRANTANYTLTTYCDRDRPLTGGGIGFYTEDASADFTNMVVQAP